MKLIHITATHLNSAGGIPVVLKNLAEAQNRIPDMNATVVSLNADVEHLHSDCFVRVKLDGLEKYLQKQKPDIVIIHSFFHPEYMRVAQILIRNHIRYYIEPHGSFMKAGMGKSRLKKTVANATVFRRLIRCAYGYIYLNKGEMKRSLYHTKHDIIIPNGIIPDEQAHEKSDNIKMYYIGRYDIHEKGIDTLIDALSILDQRGCSFAFDFFGDGEKESIAFIKERTAHLKNIAVRVNGPVYHEEKDKLLSGYNISVLLSLHEGLPMTILESWNYGNPCFVTAGTNMAEECVKAQIGWLAGSGAEEVAAQTELLLKAYANDKEGYVKRCREHIARKYTWDKIARRSCCLLKQHE